MSKYVMMFYKLCKMLNIVRVSNGLAVEQFLQYRAQIINIIAPNVGMTSMCLSLMLSGHGVEREHI